MTTGPKGRRTIRGRLRSPGPRGEGEGEETVEIDVGQLTGVFAAPGWLRDIGITAWLLVGITLLAVGVVWLLSLTHVIVTPVLAAAVIASVSSPVVGWARRHGIPRAIASALLLVAIVAIGTAVVLLTIAGITSQADAVTTQLTDAQERIETWIADAGVGEEAARRAGDDAATSISDAVSQLLNGIGAGVSALSSLAFFAALVALSLFFLLKDGPQIRAWAERRLDLPLPVAHLITRRLLEALRGYFLGVTIVAAFNGAVIGIGALVLGVPLAATIAIVSFLAAYIPYLGAWTAGAFAVLIALGAEGPETAVAMAVVVLLANGALQQIVQPFAYGATLNIHPLAVLIVTIAGGALFGAAGLILAAPLTAAATRVSADLAEARSDGRGSIGDRTPDPDRTTDPAPA